MEQIKIWADEYLVPSALADLQRLWSIRVALFWGSVSALYGVLPAFQSFVPAPLFAGATLLASILMVFARLLQQPGIE